MANDRLYQEPVEAVIQPDNAKARLSQEAVEVVVLPTDAKARLSQIVVEAVYPSSNPTGGTGYAWGQIIG